MIHRFYFKVAYTTQTLYYDVSLNITLDSFILNIKNKIKTDLNIGRNCNIDIVEAGQFDNINGPDAELAPALEPSNLTLLQKYENNYKQTSFYIRNR
jgi:hypothetical protein